MICVVTILGLWEKWVPFYIEFRIVTLDNLDSPMAPEVQVQIIFHI